MQPTLPARWYHEPTIFEAERRRIFDAHWLIAAHVTALPSPSGAAAVQAGGRRLVLVRKPDGTLRAFHNVCRHRAAPLLWDNTAEACKALRCRYHGWRYSLDGALTATPGFGEPVPESGWDLFPVHHKVWRGFVFVCFAERPPPLADAIAGLDEAARDLPLEAMSAFHTAKHTLQCNWKTYVENYLEGYHIPWLHPGLSREVTMRDYRVTVKGRAALHEVSTRPDALSQGFWAWLWPNVALNFYGTGLSLEQMQPVSPEVMEIHYTYLAPPEATEEDRQRAMEMSQEVTEEDIQVCEAVQKNLAAGQYHAGRLSPRHEGGVAAFQSWIRQCVEAALA